MDQAQLAITQFAKDVREVTYIEHGADNIVALVNKEFVFRFPRHENAAHRLAYETALLQKIGKNITAVSTPELLQVHTRPLYVVAKYIEGEHYSGKQIQALTADEQVAIGKTVATFISQLNKAISGLEVGRLREESAINGLAEPWEDYFNRLFSREHLPNDKLRPVIDEYYAIWKTYVAQEHRTYAIHDDLHPSNLLFSGAKLTGIVDFGDTNRGGIEEEMRWLYLMGDTVVNAAIEHYQQLTGETINHDHIRVWAIMHELSSYTSHLANEDTESYPFRRAQAHLREWVPNFPL